ncbi:MAG: hypothetical protein N3A66_08015 [Planctomycetota bacterium]|nr:hypothetical protein [Planctomycetota bacterium]
MFIKRAVQETANFASAKKVIGLEKKPLATRARALTAANIRSVRGCAFAFDLTPPQAPRLYEVRSIRGLVTLSHLVLLPLLPSPYFTPFPRLPAAREGKKGRHIDG